MEEPVSAWFVLGELASQSTHVIACQPGAETVSVIESLLAIAGNCRS